MQLGLRLSQPTVEARQTQERFLSLSFALRVEILTPERLFGFQLNDSGGQKRLSSFLTSYSGLIPTADTDPARNLRYGKSRKDVRDGRVEAELSYHRHDPTTGPTRPAPVAPQSDCLPVINPS